MMSRYDPGMLARLAFATGQAQYHQGAVERDMGFLNAEANRNADWNMSRMNNEYQMQTMMAEQARKKQEDQLAFTLQDAAVRRRANTPTAKTERGSSLAKSIVDRLPSAQPAMQQRGTGFIRQHGVLNTTTEINPDGSLGQTLDPEQEIELVDQRTGELDMTRFPLSTSFQRTRTVAGGGAFPTRMPSPAVQAQVSYIDAMKAKLPPDQHAALMVAAKSGLLDMNKLIDQTEDAMPASPKAGRREGLNLRDRQLNLQSLRTRRASLIASGAYQAGDPELGEYDNLIREQETAIQAMTNSQIAPQVAGTIDHSVPTPGGKVLTRDAAQRFMGLAGNNKELARRLAREEGYNF